ncbi:cyclin-like protein [Syncephalastrum racemosum]|uniref:Cyclin-like protein n=1 Tax=Syncephalastrum racemosum TaxID=13706 RepID=A0A1X2HU52_SYNRA|nr:cyclin-like protein [Syncephalastrum racemosum]
MKVSTGTQARFSLGSIAMDQWLFTREELQTTMPSIFNDCMSVHEEQGRRIAGCALIQTVGCRLGLSPIAIATATTFFHRFYTRHSFHDFNFEYIAGTCIFLAGKVEEAHRKLSDVIAAAAAFKYGTENHNKEKSRVFIEWREAILSHEILVMETLCFDFAIKHPQYYLFEFAEELKAPTDVLESASALAFDSARLPLCLMYKPRLIAAGCMILAYRANGLEVPLGDRENGRWSSLLAKDSDTLEEVMYEIMTVYQTSESHMNSERSRY